MFFLMLDDLFWSELISASHFKAFTFPQIPQPSKEIPSQISSFVQIAESFYIYEGKFQTAVRTVILHVLLPK